MCHRMVGPLRTSAGDLADGSKVGAWLLYSTGFGNKASARTSGSSGFREQAECGEQKI